MTRSRLLLLLAVVAAIVAFVALDLGRFTSLAWLKSQQAVLVGWYDASPATTLAIFFAAYVAVTGLLLPGAAAMTLAAGALFGVVTGTVLVSFASTLGATLAFLASRYVLRDAVRARFPVHVATIDAGVAREGAFYLFTLRLVPVVPFAVINPAMGFTSMRTATYAWVSQLGMLTGTSADVNADTQLGQIDSLRGVLSPGLLGSFALLGVLPLVLKKVVDAVFQRFFRAV